MTASRLRFLCSLSDLGTGLGNETDYMMRHSRHRKSLGSMPPSGNNVVGENEVQNPTNPKFFLFRHWKDTRYSHYSSRGQSPRPLSHEHQKERVKSKPRLFPCR